MIIKHFKLALVDNNNDIVLDIDEFDYIIPSGTYTGTNVVIDSGVINTIFGGPDFSFLACGILETSTSKARAEKLNEYINDKIFIESLPNWSNTYKYKLYSDSGYYALSNLLPVYPGASTTWTLYDNNDTILATNYEIAQYAYGENYFIPYITEQENDFIISLRLISINSRISGSTYAFTISQNRVINQSVIDWYNGVAGPTPPGPDPGPEEDPYTQGDESDTGGGEGDFDNTSDVIDLPAYPTSTVDNTGFISLYNPDMVQLRALASYMWGSQGLDLDTFKRIFSDPISTILGLTIMPVAPVQGSSRAVVLGNVSTGVQMPRVDQQFTRFDCGTLNINEYWGGYLDYSPYTQAEIYLPFIGVKKLDADDIMGKAVNVSYMFDFLSGACCAYIKVNGSVLYQFAGQCAASIPVTGNDMTSMINGVMSMVSSGISGFMAGGASGAAVGAVGSLAANVSNMKPHAEKSGSMGGMAGLLGVRSPYIILTRPRQALPANQNTFTGYPSYITEILGNLTGFTQVQDIHLTNIGAMDAEIEEIESLLKEGVYL